MTDVKGRDEIRARGVAIVAHRSPGDAGDRSAFAPH